MAKLLIFDLDGTLFNLAIDWDSVKRNVAASSVDATSFLRGIELQGVANGSGTSFDLDRFKMLVRHYPTAIVSRNFRETIHQAVQKIGLLDTLYIVGKEDVAKQKPDSEGVRRVLDHFACESGDAIFIGDTYHDIEAAHAAGVFSVIVKNERNAYVPNGADAYIDSLDELDGLLDIKN